MSQRIHAKKMSQAVERILRNHEKLEAFRTKSNFAVRILNPPYMRLAIERHGSRVTVTHYFEQNGDLVCDPDMEFEILDSGDWMPVAIQHASGLYFRAMEVIDGRRMIRPRQFKDQIRFSSHWAKNLIDQGFHRDTAKAV